MLAQISPVCSFGHNRLILTVLTITTSTHSHAHYPSLPAASRSTLRFLVGIPLEELQELLTEASFSWWCLRTFTVSDHSLCSDSHVSSLLQKTHIFPNRHRWRLSTI